MTGLSFEMMMYIDPGVGSLIIQGAIAALATISFVFRRYIIGALRWMFKSDQSSGQESGKPEGSGKKA